MCKVALLVEDETRFRFHGTLYFEKIEFVYVVGRIYEDHSLRILLLHDTRSNERDEEEYTHEKEGNRY